MINIKTIKNAQVFYGKSKDGSHYRFKAFGDAYQNEFGFYEIECTDLGDFIYIFDDGDSDILYATKEDVYK